MDPIVSSVERAALPSDPHRGLTALSIHTGLLKRSANRGGSMRYRANDLIVHPQHGVGRVVKLETRTFGQGKRQEYYEIAIPTGTVWVPVEGPANGLRKLGNRADLGRYRAVLRGRPTPLASDHKQRQIALVERLKESSFQSRCEVVRDLTGHRWDRPPDASRGAL